MLAPLRILMGLIGIFWMAIGAGWAVYWWATSAPLGWPNYRLGGKVIGITLHLPDSPGARLQALLAAGRKAEARAKAVTVQQAQVSQEIGLTEAKAQERIHTVYRTVRKEITLHVTPAIDRAYPLPVSLVRMHDASVWGVSPLQLSLPAGQFDESRSAVAPSELAATINDNYGACRENSEQLSALQRWVRDQAAIK